MFCICFSLLSGARFALQSVWILPSDDPYRIRYLPSFSFLFHFSLSSVMIMLVSCLSARACRLMWALNFYFSASISDIFCTFSDYRRADEHPAVCCDNGMAANHQTFLITEVFIPAIYRDVSDRYSRLVRQDPLQLCFSELHMIISSQIGPACNM